MYENIDEVITVIAAFGNDPLIPIKPLWFKWKGRTYQVEHWGYSRRSKEGEVYMHTIGCIDKNSNFYELRLNTKTGVWKLERIGDGEVH